jgi:hypothetical protein
MTCEYCIRWAATSERQLHRRLQKLREHPEITPHTCPRCGGTDWAYTPTRIEKEFTVFEYVLFIVTVLVLLMTISLVIYAWFN